MSFCNVQLDNLQRKYYPGSDVTGRVICLFDQSKHVRAIRVKLKGTEHTSWVLTRQGRRRHPRQHKGINKFFALETTIREEGHLNPGRYEYHFKLTLPENIPGSYYGSYGSIKFTVKAIVDRTIGHNYKDEKEFVVIALVDLNTMIDNLNLGPIAYSEDKTLRCCCCSRGAIIMIVHLEKEAYVPGEPVKVKVVITNMSLEDVERVDVKITKTTESVVTSPTIDRKYDYELLASASDYGVGAHSDRSYNFQLEIPRSTMVHNFNLCTLFKQWTNLKVTAVLPGFHISMSVSARIVLGHIEVGGQFQNVILQQNTLPYLPQENNNFSNEGWDPNRPLGDNTVLHNTSYPLSVTLYSPSDLSSSGAVPYPVASSGTSRPDLLPMVHNVSAPSRVEIGRGEDPHLANMLSSSSGGNGSDPLPPPTYDEAIALPPFLPK